jgi:methylated-DNA-[protein]-cysteine S-methyltransferase
MRSIEPPSATLYTLHPSPIGDLLLRGDEQHLRGVHFVPGPRAIEPGWRRADAPFARVREQLEAYFAGERVAFELPVDFAGAPAFFGTVWRRLLAVAFGATVSYGELARQLGRPSAARAVGLANSRNPIAIIVPCHRVIGSEGSLTGYAGGLHRKRYLLRHETDVLTRSPDLRPPAYVTSVAACGSAQ